MPDCGCMCRAHHNKMLKAVADYVHDNITSGRTPEIATLLGVPETGDLALHMFGSPMVNCSVHSMNQESRRLLKCLLIVLFWQPLVRKPRTKESAPGGLGFISSEKTYPSLRLFFLSVFTRLRRIDHSLHDGKECIVNLMQGKDIRVVGKGLPAYNSAYIGVLMAALKGLSPEGLLAMPTDPGCVMEFMDREMPR